jgi:predicted aspartyl protease
MPDTSKIADRATEFASQAAAAAGPLAARAKELAGQAAAAAAPIAEQARVRAAQGVAGSLDKATGGKYSARIHSVATKVESVLDTGSRPPATDPTLKADVADLPHDRT